MGRLWGRNLGVGLILALFVFGCTRHDAYVPPQTGIAPVPHPSKELRTQRPYQVNGVWYYPLPSSEGYVEEGMASWYGPHFHGKATSCGETYNMDGISAAHKTLPLGTYVKVTNLNNGQSTVLRVNDRGPFVGGRIIDLSRGAARQLGCFEKGLARVRVEAVQCASEVRQGQNTYWKVDPVPSFRYGQFTVQIGAFREQSNAARLKEKMSSATQYSNVIPTTDDRGTFYRVQVGNFQDIQIARQQTERLRSGGFPDAFVLAVEGK